MCKNTMKEVPNWPVIVFDSDEGADVYTQEEWYSDADLCSAGTWSDAAKMVDSTGAVFDIKFRVLKEGRFLWILPYQEATNELVATGKHLSADEFISLLAEDLKNHGRSVGDPESYLDSMRDVSPKDVYTESMRYLRNT